MADIMVALKYRFMHINPSGAKFFNLINHKIRKDIYYHIQFQNRIIF